MRTKFIKILILSFISFQIYASNDESVKYPTFSFDGLLKTKFEYAPSTDSYRFSVRNSRVGMKGSINEYFSYRGQIELNDNGVFRVLDLYGTYQPLRNLSFSMGQSLPPFHNNYIVSPGQLMFSNKAFIGKYFLGGRDLGVQGQYIIENSYLPITLEGSLYNSHMLNAPVWTDQPSYGGRVTLGSIKGLRASVKYFDYTQNDIINTELIGADIRYEAPKWKLEAEIMNRQDEGDIEIKYPNLLSYYFQGAYVFSLKDKYMFKHITPAIRWEGIDANKNESGFDVNRLTMGLSFGITEKYFSSLLRFDYERYLINNRLDFMQLNEEMGADKFTVELVLIF